MNKIEELAKKTNGDKKPSLHLDLANLKHTKNQSTPQSNNNKRPKKNTKRQQQKIRRAVTMAGLFTLATLSTGVLSFKISSTASHNKQTVSEALKEVDELDSNDIENQFDLYDIGDRRDFSILLQQTDELLNAANSKFNTISEKDAKKLANNLDIIYNNKNAVVTFAEDKILSAIGKKAKISTRTVTSPDGLKGVIDLMENDYDKSKKVAYIINDGNSKFKNNKNLATALDAYFMLCPPTGQPNCENKEECFNHLNVLFSNTKNLAKDSIGISDNTIINKEKDNEQAR